MTAVLKISDGTTEIDLLDANTWLLETWGVAVPQAKGGGTYQQSSLSDGRRLVNRVFDTVLESLSLKCGNQPDQDSAIFNLQELERLLEKAVQYWTTDWQNEPVWIEAQASCETELRYAVIQQYSIPELENWYEQPFAADPVVIDNVTLILERLHWQADEPGTRVAVAISAVESFDERNLGNVNSSGVETPTTATEEVYVCARRNTANLTHIFIDDGGAFSANLMDAALPFDFLPAVPAVNDYVYFGCDTTEIDSGPFGSLVFDISVAQNDLELLWYYWNGAWAVLADDWQDNTDDDGDNAGTPFNTTGVKSFHFPPPSDWTTTAINGVTGYWIRATVTAIGAAPSPPRQQNRDIYAITWPYVEMAAAQVAGDIPALAEFRMSGRGSVHVAAVSRPFFFIYRIMCGMRSLDRGEDFTAYLNVSDEQNPAFATATTRAGGVTTFVVDTFASSGRSGRWNPAGVVAMGDRFGIVLTPTGVLNYVGEFRMFVRVRQNGGSAGDFLVQAVFRYGDDTPDSFTTPSVATTRQGAAIDDIVALDLGNVTLPLTTGTPASEETRSLDIVIQASNSNGTPGDLYTYDIILVPIDEFAFDAQNHFNSADGALGHPATEPGGVRILSIDSLTAPKRFVWSAIREYDAQTSPSTAALIFEWLSINNSRAILQANEAQRAWFFLSYSGDRSNPSMSVAVNINASARYLSARGER